MRGMPAEGNVRVDAEETNLAARFRGSRGHSEQFLDPRMENVYGLPVVNGEKRKALRRWALAAALAGALVVLSSVPGGLLVKEERLLFSGEDKVFHAAAYFLLAVLVARAMNVPRRKAWLVGGAAFAAAAAFGAAAKVGTGRK